MSAARRQARTRRVSLRTIVACREFARGLDEVRKGLPFNPDNRRVGLRARPLLRLHRSARHAAADRPRPEPEGAQARGSGVQPKASDMKKPKKTEAPKRKLRPLDLIAAQIHAKLKQTTKDVIEIGNLLIESRDQLEHGEWQRGWPIIST